MPDKQDFFKGFTILDDVPMFAVSEPDAAHTPSARIENFSDYVVSRKEPQPIEKAVTGPKAMVNSFVSKLREQREQSARRPETGHYL